MFPKNEDIEKNFIEEIKNSIEQRLKDKCDSWGTNDTLKLPWGVKLNVKPEFSKLVSDYIENIKDTELNINNSYTIKVLRADLKERRNKFALIVRYKVI